MEKNFSEKITPPHLSNAFKTGILSFDFKSLFKKRKNQRIFIERMQNKKTDRILKIFDKSNAIIKKSQSILSESICTSEDLNSQIEDFNNRVSNFKDLLEENQRLLFQLQVKEKSLNQWEENLKELSSRLRKQEINIHIQSEGIKKEQQLLNKKDRSLDSEREEIIHREKKALESEKKYTEQKEKYDTLLKELEKEKDEHQEILKDIKEKQKNLRNRTSELKHQEESLKNKEMDCETIKANLEEKIKEYDLKIASMEDSSEIMENIKFDASDEGSKSKIVVKEAIRAGIKELENTLQKFNELNELYGSGTFKGFSVTFDEISSVVEELKIQYAAVKEHAESTGLDFSIWLEKIETAIVEADKNNESFLFAAGYRSALEGLTLCRGYADMINLFNSYTSDESEGNTDEESNNDEWDSNFQKLYEEDYDPDYDYLVKNSFDDFKKQYRKMARKYHPDLADDDSRESYEEKTKALNEIWEKLKAYFEQKKAA